MKYDTPKTIQKEQEEIKPSKVMALVIDPKGAERFTVKREQVGDFVLNKAYDLGGQLYRLAAIMKDGDGVSLEFVKQQ